MIKTAFRFIRYDRPKSIGALAGVIISVFLVGQQLGIFIFLTNAMAALVRNNPDYIWVVDNQTSNVNALSPLDMRLGRAVSSVPGVQQVFPVALATAAAKFENGESSPMTLIGVQAPEYAGGPWNLVTGKPENLIQDGAIITEYFDRNALGDAEVGDYFELNGRKVFIAGQTRGVRSFGGVYAFTTIERARSIGNLDANTASAFLVKWDPAVPRQQVIDSINAYIYGVRAWDPEVLAGETIGTVLSSSGIAFSFGTLILFALISGFVIIGLTLYSAAVDRLRDYGTLKAIGATNGYVRRLILSQALLISLTGFAVAVLLIEGFRNGIANAGTIFRFTPAVWGSLLGVTVLIAVTGSLFAIRRISRLEPAQVFRA